MKSNDRFLFSRVRGAGLSASFCTGQWSRATTGSSFLSGSVLLKMIVACLVLGSIGEAAEPIKLRVLCYNIHYGQGMDKKYDVERLAKAIKNTKPDLVALQEVDVGVERSSRMHEARMLSEMTGLAVRFGPTQHYQGGLFGNAVLTNLPITDVHIQPLPYTESSEKRTTYPRAAIAVTLKLPNGSPLKFISTHFQHNVPEDRVAEAKAINKHFVDNEMPAILAGDMNAPPGSEPINILEEHWKNAIDPEAAFTAPSDNPRMRIDYIFSRGTQLKMLSSEVINEQMASDHLPVLVVFEVAQ